MYPAIHQCWYASSKGSRSVPPPQGGHPATSARSANPTRLATAGGVAHAETRFATRARFVAGAGRSATRRVLNHFGSSPPTIRRNATYRHGSQWYVYTVKSARSRGRRDRRYSRWSHIPHVTIGKKPKEIARVAHIGSEFVACTTPIRSRNVRSQTTITSGEIRKRERLIARSSRFLNGTFGIRRNLSFRMYSTNTWREPHAHRVRWRNSAVRLSTPSWWT